MDITKEVDSLYDGLDDREYLIGFLSHVARFFEASYVGIGWVDHVTGSREYHGSNLAVEL